MNGHASAIESPSSEWVKGELGSTMAPLRTPRQQQHLPQPLWQHYFVQQRLSFGPHWTIGSLSCEAIILSKTRPMVCTFCRGVLRVLHTILQQWTLQEGHLICHPPTDYCDTYCDGSDSTSSKNGKLRRNVFFFFLWHCKNIWLCFNLSNALSCLVKTKSL